MNGSMLALVYQGIGQPVLERRPVPELRHEKDAIVRMTRAAICTSDLHILRGKVPRAVPGTALGHEFVGEVVAVGKGVTKVAPGNRVAANCITFCGECWFCRHGYINNCERGGWELGCRIDGGHAEFVREPYADQSLSVIPDSISDEQALFVGDILSSGYFGAELCEINPGDTVAVIGAGPVGLCAMQCARLFGAAKVIALDIDTVRLNAAYQFGLADVTVNPLLENVNDKIVRITQGRGADGVVEAAGGRDSFQIAWQIARPNSVVALVAMYEENQIFPLPSMYGKNLVFKTGGVDAVHCDRLLTLLSAGKLNTDFLITHRVPLNHILDGYQIFQQRQDGCLKCVITPPEE